MKKKEFNQVFNGVVKRKPLAQGSKQEHTALVLEMADGQSLRLRSVKGNPFAAKEFESFIGQTVEVTAKALNSKTLLVDDVTKDVKIKNKPCGPGGCC